MIKRLIDKYSQVLKFGIVGSSGTITNLIIFSFAFYFFKIGKDASAVIAFAAAVTQNYFLNATWTFRGNYDGKNSLLRYFKYILSNIMGLFVNLVVINALSLIFPFNHMVLFQMAGIVSGMSVNFLLARNYIFKGNNGDIRTTTGKAISYEKILALVVFLGMVISIVYHYMVTVHAGKPFPINTFFFLPEDQFNDYFNMIAIVKDFNPYFSSHFFSSYYYPVANAFFLVFSFIQDRGLGLFFFLTIFLILYIRYLRKEYFQIENSSAVNMLIICVFSYPLLWALDRANIEIYLFLFVLMFLHYYDRKKFVIASLLISIPIAMKVYPAVFLILMIKDKKYLFFLLSGISALVMSIVSILLTKGGFYNNIIKIIAIPTDFFHAYSSSSGLSYNFSFYGLIKVVWFYIKLKAGQVVSFPDFDASYFRIYGLVCIVLFAITVYVIINYSVKRWKIISILTIIATAFPNVSFDYKLIYFIIPVLYFLKEEHLDSLKNHAVAVLFGLILIPKDYYYFDYSISIAVVINPLLIMLLALLCLVPEEMNFYKLFQLKRGN